MSRTTRTSRRPGFIPLLTALLIVASCAGEESPVSTLAPIDPTGASQLRIDPGRSGVDAGEIGDNPSVSFRVEVGEPVIASPIAVGGIAFVCDGVDRLLAIDIDAGREVWASSVGACDASVVVTADTVFSLSSDGVVRRHDRSDGRIRWETELGGSTRSSPLFAGGALVAVSGSSLHRLDPASGTVLDRVEIGRQVGSSPSAFGDRLLVGTAANTVVDGAGAVVVDLGPVPEELTTFTDGIAATAAVSGDIAVIGSTSGLVVAFDASGETRWETDVGSPVYASAALTADAALLSTAAGELLALDTVDGAVRWRTDLGDASYSSPVLVAGTVLVTAENGELFAVDAATGSVRWSITVGVDGNFMASTPVVAGSTIVVGSNDGTVVGVTTGG